MTDLFAPAGRGVQHANLRAANRRAVLTTIALSSGISNADVSRRTGLAPQTASAIVSAPFADSAASKRSSVANAPSPGTAAVAVAAAERAQELGFPATAVELYRGVLEQPGADRAALTLGLVTALLDDGRAGEAEAMTLRPEARASSR